MLTSHSFLLVTILLVPVLLFGSETLNDDSFLVPITGIVFAILTGLLIALATTRTSLVFVRKLIASSVLAAAFYLTTFVVSWTWAEERRFHDSGEWAPVGIEATTAPIRVIAAVFGFLAVLGLVWLSSAVEVSEPI